ncbi:hypothetical protein AGMMS49543_20900 [Betaproteobacteria bacterium]|nr:hypothetical protein AGMMS49543_20900 [Betaproteobacteria bacterium]
MENEIKIAPPESEAREFNIRVMTAINEIYAPKTQKNTHAGYSYRTCSDILDAAKKVLLKYNLRLTLTDSIYVTPESTGELTRVYETKDKNGVITKTREMSTNRVYVKATAILTDGVFEIRADGYAREDLVKKGSDGSQTTGSASTYARKRALDALFCIDDTPDPDSTSEMEKQGRHYEIWKPAQARAQQAQAKKSYPRNYEPSSQKTTKHKNVGV